MKGMLLVAIFVCAAGWRADEVPDERIKELVIRSGLYIHSAPAAATFNAARELCGTDTNRFAQIICELAQTNDMRISRRMIGILGKCGTTAQLPYLHSVVTNATLGGSAATSVLRMEGATSNAVDLVGKYLAMTNVDFSERADVCKVLLKAAAMSGVDAADCQFARSVAWGYAMTANRYVMGVDATFIGTDPSYRYSRRRLSVMRSVNALGVSQHQLGYVTNAINELVAYPESNLSE